MVEIFKENKILSGSYDINKWLNGGYESGIITLFYGPSGSGKTNFVLLAACQQAKLNKKVIFIDTEGGFSIERIKQITMGIPEFVLKNIIILKPTNFSEQKKAFLTMLKELRSKNVGLIIVDSMTMHYRLELAEARKKGQNFLNEINNDLVKQMKALSEIARKRDIPVLITSQIYTGFLSEEDFFAGKEAEINVVGGNIMKYWSKCIIELENINDKKRAILKKHRSISKKTFNFEIINEGIRKRGWL